jgi:hypothetical protein
MLQDGSQYAPKGPKNVPRWLQEASKASKELHFCFLAFSLPIASRGLKMAPRWPKRAPREAQESPKTAPRAPKNAPRAPQEGFPRNDFGGSRRGARIGDPPANPSSGPKTAQTGPTQRQQTSNMGVKGHPRGAREGPKTFFILITNSPWHDVAGPAGGPSLGPKDGPGRPQTTLREFQEMPRRAPERPQRAPHRWGALVVGPLVALLGILGVPSPTP